MKETWKRFGFRWVWIRGYDVTIRRLVWKDESGKHWILRAWETPLEVMQLEGNEDSRDGWQTVHESYPSLHLESS